MFPIEVCIYQQSVAHAFTICRIYGLFAVTMIWMVQNYLQLLLCPVILIIAIQSVWYHRH